MPPLTVIPGRGEAPNPESRSKGNTPVVTFPVRSWIPAFAGMTLGRKVTGGTRTVVRANGATVDIDSRQQT